MKKRLKVAAGFLISALVLLSSVSNTYAALPYYEIEFPRDHAGHQSNIPYEYPNEYRSEWWYFSGKLTNFVGNEYYYAVSINQHYATLGDGSMPGILYPMYLGNILITDLETETTVSQQVYFPESMTSVSDTALDIRYEIPNPVEPEKSSVFDLYREPYTGVFVLQGKTLVGEDMLKLNLALYPTVEEDDALMTNGDGMMEDVPVFPWETASMYNYTYPKMYTAGVFSVNGNAYFVNPLKSNTSMEHQWGDYNPNIFYSWDNFSVKLDNGMVGNIYINVENNENKDIVNGYAEFILPNGSRVYEEIDTDFDWTKSDYWTAPWPAPYTRVYPMTHELNFESLDLTLTVHSDIEAQTIFGPVNAFWQGYATVSGEYNGNPVSGDASKMLWYSR